MPRAAPVFDDESSSVHTFYSLPDEDEVTTLFRYRITCYNLWSNHSDFRSVDEAPTPTSPSTLVHSIDESNDAADIHQTTSL